MSLPPAPRYRQTPLRVSCVQYDPQLGQVAANARKVEAMTTFLRPGQLDLLVLPEMALTGYIFRTASSILPFLETGDGPTTKLATSLARRLGCHVVAGYPEAAGDAGVGAGGGDGKVGWNSAVVVGPAGVVGIYRKTFLFETDKSWAREGDGFRYFELPPPIGRLALGICMDMNPREFIAPWDAFELATFAKQNSVDTLVVPMNWLDPPAEPPTEDDADGDDVPAPDPLAPSVSNLNYWAARLTPLHDPAPSYAADTGGLPVPGSKEVVFVACNRVGVEEGTRFVGTSCVMTASTEPSAIELIEVCNSSEERVMLATVA
ncbi:hypothetical protein Q5752_003618 [Cryptotrichosporon argae]